MLAPTIVTERLVLRGWQECDLMPLAEFYATDPAAIFVGGQRQQYDTAMWLMGRIGQWALRGYGAFVITERNHNELLGWCGASQAPGVREPDLQWALVEPARGKGYMAEAGRPVLEFLFQATGRQVLHTTIHPENVSSQATAHRLGGSRNGATVIEDVHVLDVWQFSRACT
ncbi:MAG: GNAT family N-acetyltransferase [Bosea sp. (in: a-proteobacteria)]